jgi:RpiR family carbohydrate utilization transcriptional regulator
VELAGFHGSEALRLRVLQKYDGLSRAERSVADVALARGASLIDCTIADLARESGVSEPTVVRFCNSIGFRGIKELKRAAVSVPTRVGPAGERVELDEVDSEEKLISFVLDRMQDALRETFETFDRERLAAALDLLEDARFLRVVGTGGSAIAARHAQHYFRRLGIPCATFSVYEPEEVAMERYDRGDVVLAFSMSGNTPLVVDIVADAKRKGASVICVTAWGENRLRELADVSLQTPFCGEGAIYGHRALERTAQLAAVNLLYAGLSLRRS